MGALTARRGRPDRGRAIVVGRGGMLINVGAAARPVGWEHGLTVEAAAQLADW
jgi:nucleotidyltransferase/DNA polymerase involved in DNA repair